MNIPNIDTGVSELSAMQATHFPQQYEYNSMSYFPNIQQQSQYTQMTPTIIPSLVYTKNTDSSLEHVTHEKEFEGLKSPMPIMWNSSAISPTYYPFFLQNDTEPGDNILSTDALEKSEINNPAVSTSTNFNAFEQDLLKFRSKTPDDMQQKNQDGVIQFTTNCTKLGDHSVFNTPNPYDMPIQRPRTAPLLLNHGVNSPYLAPRKYKGIVPKSSMPLVQVPTAIAPSNMEAFSSNTPNMNQQPSINLIPSQSNSPLSIKSPQHQYIASNTSTSNVPQFMVHK